MRREVIVMLGCFLILSCIAGCAGISEDNPSSGGDTDGADFADADFNDTDSYEPVEVHLSGALEKGPFVMGSTVNISPVDSNGNPTGLVFSTQTISDLGEFSVDFEASGFVSLEGTGFYYNEVTGDLSGANLTLRAYYEITAGGVQNAYLNLITHLTYNRVKKLIGDGVSGAVAIEQAEDELQAALPVGPDDLVLERNAIEMTLQGGDTVENAYLFAVSAVLSHAARIKSPASPDAALQELINGISVDLADDGQLNTATVEQLVEAQVLPRELGEFSGGSYLIPDVIMEDLAARFADLGSTAVVPDLNRVLDSDFDMIVNADDNCWWIPNFGQSDDNENDIGDACDIVFADTDSGLGWQNPSNYHADYAPEPIPEGEHHSVDWAAAAAYCEDLTWGGFDDWRLPSIDALRTLVDGCPSQAFEGSCPVHNNGCPAGDCIDECPACDEENGPYWKTGLMGPAVAPSRTQGWSIDFLTAELSKAVRSGHLRCVRGYMDSYELVCTDSIDDDGDGKTDCDDDECFALIDEAGDCNNFQDLAGIAGLDFWNECIGREPNPSCYDMISGGSEGCIECYYNCIHQYCHDVCMQDGPPNHDCKVCGRTNCFMPGECFGTFVCEPEFYCADGIDNEGDGLTDMTDPDCVKLVEALPDGDADDDTDGDTDIEMDIDADGDADVDGSGLSSPVVSGDSVTFYYVNNEAISVNVVGNFTDPPWNPNAGIPMDPITFQQENVWTATVYGLACGDYKYKFFIREGETVTDPLNPENDGSPYYRSMFTIEEGCTVDGDADSTEGDAVADGDEEEASCENRCGYFPGKYCLESTNGEEAICNDFFAQGVPPLRVANPNFTDCSFQIWSSGMFITNVDGCDFSDVYLGNYRLHGCLLSSSSSGQTLNLSCRSGQCGAVLKKTSCGETDGDEDSVEGDTVVDGDVDAPESEAEHEEEEITCPSECANFVGRYCQESITGDICGTMEFSQNKVYTSS